MKKLLLFSVILFSSYTIFSQNNIGISFGNNWSKMDVKNDGFEDRWINDISNYNFGIFYNRDLNNFMELQVDLNYQRKGFSQKVNEGSFIATSKLNVDLNYINVPVKLNSKIKIKDISILFGVGGYIGVGIHGDINSTVKTDLYTETYSTSDIWSKDPENGMGNPYSTDPEELVYASGYLGLKRLDYGLVSMFGVDYKNIRLSFEYDLGLPNIQIENSYGSMFNHKSYNLSISYKFNLRKKEL